MRREELLDRLVSILFPKRCVLCGEAVPYDDLHCGGCALPVPEEPSCLRCGRGGMDCICAGTDRAFDRAVAPLSYTGTVRDAVIALKKRPDARAAAFFAQQMVKKLGCIYGGLPFGLIVEVPAREGGSGHSHALLLARQVGGLTGIPLAEGVLLRRENSKAQHGLDRQARFRSAAEGYSLRNPDAVKGKQVLLIDDVFTTGATAHTCAGLLRRGGAAGVTVLTAAATSLRKER